MIHVHQCFNAVGHGTFFNGLVHAEGYPDSFCWVYDCGSKRTTRIDQEIGCLENWTRWPEEIDLLVLSHFDDDHVNGVERLLKSRRVRVLALPFMDIAHSLGCAASIGAEPSAASTAAFQLDPAAWLQSRGLAQRVETILLIQGGPREEGAPPVDGAPAPFPGGPGENQIPLDGREEQLRRAPFRPAGGRAGTRNLSTPQTLIWSHARSIRAQGFPIELVFFNAKQPDLFRRDANGDLVARRSHRTTAVVQADVDVVVRRYGLHDLSRTPRRGWREALRGVYEKHFGTSSQQRNNISLCLLARPIGAGVGRCSIFRHRPRCPETRRSDTTIVERGATLLLGDLRIDQATLVEMQAHFGTVRWAEIGTVQVPHHGSRHSWEAGSAASFGVDRFVHCVPNSSSHHPHASVDSDLRPIPIHHANYTSSIAIDYHFPF